MQLLIDTTQKGRLYFSLFEDKKNVSELAKPIKELSEKLLLELNDFLRKRKVKLDELSKILVNPGPGRFSSTRTGVATANALALALGIPVGRWPSGRIKEVVLPKYNHAPNITKSSKSSF